MWLLMVLLLVVPVASQSAEYLCPYESSLEEGAWVRRLSITRLSAPLIDALGYPPWEEDEVAGNQALVTIQEATLPLELVAQFVTPPVSCTPKPIGYRRQPARVPRVVNGQLDFNDEDTSRPLINPHRDERGAWIRPVIRAVKNILAPPPVQADPFSVLLDQFNRANENPLSGGGNWGNRIDTDTDTDELQLLGNVVERGDLGGGSSYWAVQTFAMPHELYATVPDHTGADGTRVRLYLIYAGVATNTPDGYRVSVRNLGTGDEWELERIDDGVFTNLGATPVVTMVDGEKFRLFRNASNALIVEHFTGGTWTQRHNHTDSTYTGSASLGLGLNSTAVTLDDFGGGTLSASSPGRRGRAFSWSR